MTLLSIGEIGKLRNISNKALRYYEEIGLLKPYKMSEISSIRSFDA